MTVRTVRIASMLASATEIVAALGYRDAMIARSHECDFPRGVEALPCCTEPKIDLRGSSRDIDDRVKAVVQEGLSVYRVDGDALKALRPDVIVTQSQCEVCAVSEDDLRAAVCDWLDATPNIVTLKPDAMADIWTDIQNVADAIGAPERGQNLVADLKARMAAIADKAATLPERPSIACIEWIDPLMAAGNWMPELVEMAGGTNLFGTAGRHSPWMTWEALRDADPEVIAILPCGFDIDRTRQEMPALTDRDEWPALRAVRDGRVYVTDGNQYFNRPGPRIAESLEILAELLHPQHFDFGHKGTGWEPL
jgi:iron complex transport system substrate-binding protein